MLHASFVDKDKILTLERVDHPEDTEVIELQSQDRRFKVSINLDEEEDEHASCLFENHVRKPTPTQTSLLEETKVKVEQNYIQRKINEGKEAEEERNKRKFIANNS